MADASSDPTQNDTDASQSYAGFDVYCHECGYNLRGIETTRCPECGKESPALQNADPRIPWIHRKSIGSVRAFLKTVLFATFSPRKLSEDVYLQIDFRDAQRFRWWTIGVAMFWVVTSTVLFFAAGPYDLYLGHIVNDLYQMVWPCVVANILILLYMILATGVPSLFFDYRDIPVNLRNNAIALSYYCIAPLTWWPLPVVVSILIFREAPIDIRNRWIAIPLTTIAVIAPATPAILWCFQIFRIARRVLRNQTGRKAWLMMGIPILWMLAGVLVLVLIPLAVFYTWVLIDVLS